MADANIGLTYMEGLINAAVLLILSFICLVNLGGERGFQNALLFAWMRKGFPAFFVEHTTALQ
jgi:hypothetical protein